MKCDLDFSNRIPKNHLGRDRRPRLLAVSGLPLVPVPCRSQPLKRRGLAVFPALVLALVVAPSLAGQGSSGTEGDDPSLVGTAAAQARGTSVDSAFHFGKVDNINLFNGNLSIEIPLGQTYSAGAGLSYGLNLAYNSNIWDYEEHCQWKSSATSGPDFGLKINLAHEVPAAASNAGLGWMLELGRILIPGNLYNWDSTGRGPDNLTYVAPDGSEHAFFSTLHDGEVAGNDLAYSTDGSYLRLRSTPAGCMRPRNGIDSTLEFEGCTLLEVDFPDGSSQRFANFGISDPLQPELADWRMIRMEDAFGNGVTATYEDGPLPFTELWKLTDDLGRTQEIDLFGPQVDDTGNLYATAPQVEQGLRVHEVRLTGFGGSTLVYRFDYVLDFVERHKAGGNEGLEYTCNGSPQTTHSLEAFLLSKLTAVEGFTEIYAYEMYYYDQTGPPSAGPAPNFSGTKAGALARLRLPTGGGYAYTYGKYRHGYEIDHPNIAAEFKIKRIDSIGVVRKHILSKVGSAPPLISDVEGTWAYEPEPSPALEAPWDDATNYDTTDPDRPTGLDPCFLKTTVTDPVGNITENFFNTARIGFTREFGLPYTVCHPDTRVFFDFDGDGIRDNAQDPLTFRPITGATGPDAEFYPTIGAPPTRLLSSRVLGPAPSGGGAPPVLRETYIHYEFDDLSPTFASPGFLAHSSNSRVRDQETCFFDDPGSVPPSICSAHHWKRATRSDFDGFGSYRTTITNSSFGGNDRVQTIRNSNPVPANAGYPWGAGYTEEENLLAGDLATGPWILGLSTWTEVDQAPNTPGEVAVTLTCFDPATGFLQGRRSLASNGGPGSAPPAPQANDLLVRFSPTVSGAGNLGFVSSEEYFGGDGQNLPIGTGCEAPGALSPEYRVEATYASGALERAWFSRGGSEFLEIGDFSIDSGTGFTANSFDAADVETQFRYDALGRLVETCRPGVSVAVNEFTFPNSASSILESTLDTQIFEVPAAGGCSPGVRTTQERSIFDGHGRRIREEQRRPQRTGPGSYTSTLAEHSFEFDALDRTVKTGLWTGPGGGLTPAATEVLSFDPFSRPLQVQQPDGSLLTMSYLGERVEESVIGIETDSGEQDSVTRSTRDGLGRLFLLENRNSSGLVLLSTSYRHDEAGRLAQVCVRDTDDNPAGCGGQKRTFTYDGRGLLVSETHPEIGGGGNGTDTYAYDSRGNLLGKNTSDPAFSLNYLYDPAARVTQISAAATGSLLTEYFYGRANSGPLGSLDRRAGKLVGTKQHNRIPGPVGAGLSPDIAVTESYSFVDPAGRLSAYSVRSGSGPSFTSSILGYDALDSVLSLSYPQCDHFPCSGAGSSRVVSYQTRDGAVTAVLQNGVSFADGLDYHLDGTLRRVGHGNGVTDLLDQDTLGWRLGHIRAQGIAGGDWDYGPYTYDSAGNVTSISPGQQYRYDLLNRLTSGQVQVLDGSITQQAIQTASYDDFGNLSSLVATGTLQGPSPGTIAHSTATNRLAGISYDANGNALSGTLGSESVSYSWDLLNRMTSLQAGTVGKAYLYTAAGERLATLNPALGDAAYTPRSATNQVLRRFKKLGTLPWAWDEDYIYAGNRQLGAVTAGGEHYFHLDHLGSVRRITDSAAQLVESRDLYPFGGYILTPNADAEEFHFAGHERDANGANIVADLDYMHARYYTPYLGRFLSVDPDPGRDGWNLYGYVGNNPINKTDPTGEFGVFGALAGAVIDFGVQTLVQGKSLSEVNYVSVGVSALSGASGVGLGRVVARNVAKVGARIALNAAGSAAIGATASVVNTVGTNAVEGEALTEGLRTENVVKAAVISALAGAIGSIAEEAASAVTTAAARNANVSDVIDPNIPFYATGNRASNIQSFGTGAGNAVATPLSNSGVLIETMIDGELQPEPR